MSSPHTMLVVTRLPGRLNVEQAAMLLGFMPHDLPVLIRARLIKPLGNPAPNGPKFFSACELQALVQDREWLSKATQTVTRYHKTRNAKIIPFPSSSQTPPKGDAA